MEDPDLQFCNLGSFVSCEPMTDDGEEWLMNNIDDDSRPIFIDHRYLADIVIGAREDGLICHG